MMNTTMHNNEFLQLLILELHIRPICSILQYFSICNSMGRSEIWDKFHELRGDWTIFFFIMKFSFFLLHCVPLYVCRLCINYQDLSANLLGVAALRMLLLTFTSRFVIDFLSIRKVIIFSAIATDDRHPLRSRSIHQNAANCMTIRFRYIAQPRGVRKTYCARSRK